MVDGVPKEKVILYGQSSFYLTLWSESHDSNEHFTLLIGENLNIVFQFSPR